MAVLRRARRLLSHTSHINLSRSEGSKLLPSGFAARQCTKWPKSDPLAVAPIVAFRLLRWRSSLEDLEMTPTVYPEQVLGYLVLAIVVALATYQWFLVPAIRLEQTDRTRETSRPSQPADVQRSAPPRPRQRVAPQRPQRVVVAAAGDADGGSAASPHGRRRRRSAA
jgi:hypothetical protein